MLRELGLGLEAIGRILDRQEDQVAALRLHHSWLISERDRFAQLANTVGRTIDRLKKGKDMTADDMYNGFARDSDQARVYTEEAERRWGKGVRESNERAKKLSDAEWTAIGKQGHDATVAMAALMAAGLKPDSQRAIAAIDAHHKWICNF